MKNKLEPGIYCIKNLINGKVYVGQGQYAARRVYEHKYHLERNSDKCTVLQRAINKYGLENFEFSIIEECSVEDLDAREIWWIAELKSNNKNYGYNLSTGGESGLRGYKFPPEFGKKISDAKKAQHRVMSDEHKAKISAAQKGKPKSAGMREKLSASISGEKHWAWGTKASDETRRKLSESRSGTKNFNFGKKLEGRTSQFFGVYKECRTKPSGKSYTYWIANVSVGFQKKVVVGRCHDEETAARMYDAYVRENNLPHPLNFPIGE